MNTQEIKLNEEQEGILQMYKDKLATKTEAQMLLCLTGMNGADANKLLSSVK